MISDRDKDVESLEDFLEELQKVECVIKECVSDVLRQSVPDLTLRAYRSEWHIKGLIYHCRNIIERYGDFSREVIARIMINESTRPEIIIMHSKVVQNLMYEFYALINLTKISLDNLSKLVYPVFTNKHMPKSVSDYTSGTTNCPMYERLSNDPTTQYLIDLRNCLVHYRTFATNDNAYVIKEGVDNLEILDIAKDWVSPMAKAVFRYTDDNKVVVNIFLPDVIFDINERGDKRIANFTYENKKNLVGFSARLVRMVMVSTFDAFTYLKTPNEKFTYKKGGYNKN